MAEFEQHRSDRIQYMYRQKNVNLYSHKHYHRSFEFIFIFSGTLKCEIDGQIFSLIEKQGVLILPGQVHSYLTKDHCKSFLCIFSCDWVQEFFRETNGKYFENPVISFSDEKICRILQREDADKFLIKSVLYGICSRLFTGSALIKTDTSDSALISRLTFYLQENYRNHISLQNIARDFGYNYNYLSSLFNRHFGMNFSTYVNGFRVQCAKDYLERTDKKISEIAVLCGFDSVRNFNRIFKGEMGLTPGEFRKNSRGVGMAHQK